MTWRKLTCNIDISDKSSIKIPRGNIFASLKIDILIKETTLQ